MNARIKELLSLRRNFLITTPIYASHNVKLSPDFQLISVSE